MNPASRPRRAAAAGIPHALFETRRGLVGRTGWVVAPDGQKFLVNVPLEQKPQKLPAIRIPRTLFTGDPFPQTADPPPFTGEAAIHTEGRWEAAAVGDPFGSKRALEAIPALSPTSTL